MTGKCETLHRMSEVHVLILQRLRGVVRILFECLVNVQVYELHGHSSVAFEIIFNI